MWHSLKLMMIILISLATLSQQFERRGDKMVVKPAELIDMIIQEQIRKEVPETQHRFKANAIETSPDVSTEDILAEDNAGDEERLHARKVWSRWGKWSECSTTCDNGSIVRRRVCVAGRCAPGEVEEQRRPCFKSPCTPPPDINAAEDSHELE